MRGIAEELETEGIRVVPCTMYLSECLVKEGNLTKRLPSAEEQVDIEIGIEALKAMSSQDIGQLVVVRDGVIVAVEAVEGSDRAIIRGGKLGDYGAIEYIFS